MSPGFGRFLEIGVHAPEIRESLAFYEGLGFVQAQVAETWPHPYAVVTDGRLFIGLHGIRMDSPSLTFVLPDLARTVENLRQAGIEFDSEQFGTDVFHRATCRDPLGQHVTLLEARTFSPPQLDAPVVTTCGYFTEVGVPARDTQAARNFWESAGFVALEEQADPFPRTVLTSDLVNLALYRTRAFRQSVLTFEHADMPERLARLRERGLKLSDEMPDTLDERCNAVLIAPEGTRLLLLESQE